MLLISTTKLLERLKNQLHEKGNGGTYKPEVLKPFLQYAYEEFWENLTACVDGPGKIHTSFTISAANTNGYVPGQSIPIPADMLRLEAFRKNGVVIQPGSPDRRQFVSGELSFYGAGFYWIDGSNQVRNLDGFLVNQAASFLLNPPAIEGDIYDIVYITQCPQLVDDDNPLTDVTVDLLSNSIVQALVTRAAVFAAAKDDKDALSRARAEAQRAFDLYNERKLDQDNRPDELSAYVTSNRRDRYGF